MIKKTCRNKIRQRKHARVRKQISGTAERPRLNVFRSLSHIYAQIIDDAEGKTLVSASSLEADVRQQVESTSGREAAKIVGQLIAERARAANIEAVVFDRGGYIYHGRVAALAEGAREKGLQF